MKKLAFYLSLFLISNPLNVLCQSPTSKKIDLSAVDAFFALSQKISSHITPSEEEWGNLFETKGYAVSAANSSMRKRIIREMMDIAYNPQNSEKRDSILNLPIEENISNHEMLLSKMTLENYLDMKLNETGIKQFRADFDFNSLEKDAINRLKDFLIDPIDSLIVFPSINFVCNELDGRSKKMGIVIDFNLMYKKTPAERVDFLAHELFHPYRDHFKNSYSVTSSRFIKLLDKLQNEGIADLIDKKEDIVESVKGMGLPESIINMYRETYQNTPQILATFDSITCLFIHHKISHEEFDKQVKHFFAFGGHPNGYYMTKSIQEEGLLNDLLINFSSPLAFIKLYNKTAKKRKDYCFSEEFMHYIDDLDTDITANTQVLDQSH